ncbi:hypothetical protein NPIL_526341 [Nephila pilipes]|uniref:Uncharacterized protein n=1 Tax=Nephila pilipes TaxID=299642 RepID=A0A8X6Q2E2_NEPPI|nr:hypothetical protein NPIL_526341 [Nephila pilipes]
MVFPTPSSAELCRKMKRMIDIDVGCDIENNLNKDDALCLFLAFSTAYSQHRSPLKCACNSEWLRSQHELASLLITPECFDGTDIAAASLHLWRPWVK